MPLSVNIRKLLLPDASDATLDAATIRAREFGVSTTDYRPRIGDGSTQGGKKLAFKTEIDALDARLDAIEADVSDVEVTATGSTTARTLADWLQAGDDGVFPVFNVKHPQFGAEGNNTADDTAAIQAAIDACEDAGGGIVLLPTGEYRVTDTLVLPSAEWDVAVTLQGMGRSVTKIILDATLGSGEAVILRDVGDATVNGGGVRDLLVDADQKAEYTIKIARGKGFSFRGSSFINATVAQGVFGDATTPRFYEADFLDSWFYSNSSLDSSAWSTYNVLLQGYATDNELFGIHCAYAQTVNLYIQPGGNVVIGAHVYGTPSATYGIRVDGETRIIGCYIDGNGGTAGIYLNASNCVSIGNRLWWKTTETGVGHLVATGKSNIVITGNEYDDRPSGSAKVSYAGTAPSDSLILDDGLATEGGRLLINGGGLYASRAALGNAFLQLIGTGSQSAGSVGQGYWANDGSGPLLTLFKSRSADPTAFTIVQSADTVGLIDFAADDGVAARTCARVRVRVDGTPGSGDMPGRLEFHTAADGGTTLTERLRIKNDGAVTHRNNATTVIDASSHLGLRSYTVATLPSAAAAGFMIYVSDGTTNKRLAVSDGTNWRFPDGNVVS